MKKLIPVIMLLMTASAANAGGLVTKHASSVQLTVDAARSTSSRIGSYDQSQVYSTKINGDYIYFGILDSTTTTDQVKIVNENRVKLIKERGFKVFVYTVNSPKKAEELFNMGVDGIFTDHPDKMKHWLNYSNTDSFR